MISNMRKFVLSLDDKKEYNVNFLYSQVIKAQRVRTNLTLAEVSRGICSISYLCKLEKNAIIADESYIRAIFERINLDFDLVGKNIIKNGIENSLKAFLAEDYEAIEQLYNSIDDSIFNATNYLIKGLYYLVKKQFKQFNEIIQTLDKIKDSLFIDEVGFLFFLVIQYYIDTFQFGEAEKILKTIEHLSFKIDELRWLLDEQYFVTAFHREDLSQMYYYYYNRLVTNNNIAFPVYRKLNYRLKCLYYDSSSNFNRAFNELEQINEVNIPLSYMGRLNFWRVAIYLKGGLYVRAYDFIYENNLFLETEFVNLLLISAYKIGDESYINLACEIAKNHEFTTDEKTHIIFNKFMILRLQAKSKYEYVEFIKTNYLTNKSKYNHFIYDKILKQEYLDFLKKSSRYKEALRLTA